MLAKMITINGKQKCTRHVNSWVSLSKLLLLLGLDA